MDMVLAHSRLSGPLSFELYHFPFVRICCLFPNSEIFVCATVYCLDRLPEPSPDFYSTRENLAHHFKGTLNYKRVDVQDANNLDEVVSGIAGKHQRMDGLIAAAGVQNVTPALDYPPDKITEVSCPSTSTLNAISSGS